MVYKVMIVDDHKIFRDGFKLALEAIDNTEFIGEAANGDELLELLKKKHPNIVFVDVNMPVMNGYDTVISALKNYHDIKFIALTTFGDVDSIRKMVHAGVEGYILKNAEIEEIEKAITDVMNGKNFFSNDILYIMTKNTFEEVKKQDIKIPKHSFSTREMEVLQLLCSGNSVFEISKKLNISERTVEKHKENLMIKSETKNTVNLVIWAIRNQIVE